VGSKRNTWVYVLGQTYNFELLCQTGSTEQEIATQQAEWVWQPDNRDDIHWQWNWGHNRC